MTDFYVAPGDSLSGSIAIAVGGDTVHLTAGIHVGQLEISGREFSDAPLTIEADGEVVLIAGIGYSRSEGRGIQGAYRREHQHASGAGDWVEHRAIATATGRQRSVGSGGGCVSGLCDERAEQGVPYHVCDVGKLDL